MILPYATNTEILAHFLHYYVLGGRYFRHNKEICELRNELKQAENEVGRSNMLCEKLKVETSKNQQKLLQMEQMHQSDSNKLANFQKKIKVGVVYC